MKICSLPYLAVLGGICLNTSTLAVVTTTDAFGSGEDAFTMDFVTVANPGNTTDTTGTPNPAGSVAYTYRMGSYEVSRDMVNKANAGGELGISLHDMTSLGGNGVNKPATGISWNEAARFVNYLNVTSGSTAAYQFSTQPGDVDYVVNATITLWAPGDIGYDMTNPFRNSNSRYFLPSDDEWYKAAYYSSSGTYFNYPTGSDTIPTAVVNGTLAGTAVYGLSLETGPADVTLAGGLSSYGTMGQGDNAFEWIETESDGVNDSPAFPRGMRGGVWNLDDGFLSASYRSNNATPNSNGSVGFRVASVPEPKVVVLSLLFSAGLVGRRKR